MPIPTKQLNNYPHNSLSTHTKQYLSVESVCKYGFDPCVDGDLTL